MHLEEFAYGQSLIHRLDPRGKILLFLIFSVFCVICSSYKGLLLYNIFSVSILFLAKLPLKALIKRLVFINLFNLFLWISLVLGDLIDSFYRAHILIIKPETIKLGLMITLKSNALFLCALGLVSTTSLSSLAHALIHFKIPSKLVLIFFLSYRYFSLLHHEYDKLKMALKTKAFRPKTDFKTYRTYAYLLGMLILKSLTKAEDLYRGMLARGYRGNYPLLNHFHFHPMDYLFLFISLAYLFLIFLV